MKFFLKRRFQWGSRFLSSMASIESVLSELAVVLLALIITAEVICRSILGFSLFITEEISGYLLVAIVFLGMPLTLAEGSLFRVEFIMDKASRTGQAILMMVFNLLSLGVAIILDRELIGLVVGSWQRGINAPTVLATPLYIPQAIMAIGMTLVILVLLAQIVQGIKQLRLEETS